MILSNAQRKRFYRIFNSFIVYAWEWLIDKGILEGELPATRMPSMEEVYRIEDAIWGEQGHLEVVDEFVEAATSLSRTDRRACEAWKQGIYSRFYVDRVGHDTFFLFGDYAFAVRGITDELDEWMLELPDMVSCVLVPFDGIITYLVMLQPAQIKIESRLDATFADAIDKARSERHFARGEREFVRLAPEALEAHEASRAEQEREQAEAAEHGNEVAEGQHASPIAGIEDGPDWDRHMDDLVDVARKNVFKALLSHIDSCCLKGAPQTSLEKILGRYPVSLLRELEGTREAKRMKKPGLVSELRDFFLEDIARRARDPRFVPEEQLRELARLCEAGGQLRVSGDEPPRDGVMPPYPYPPYVNYFRDGDDYLAVVADEYRAAFEGADFARLIEEAGQVTDACLYLMMAADMRGLILLDEACEGVAERFDLLDADDVRRLVEEGMTAPAAELDGETYVFADDLVIWDDRTQRYLADQVEARTILEERVGHEPYWPTDEEAAYGSVRTMAESLDEGRALMRYVEGHIPDGEDDATFPSWILSEIVDMSVGPLEPQEATDTLTDIINCIAYNDVQARFVAPLIIELSKKLPRRSLNGLSPERFDEIRPSGPREILLLKSRR